MECVTIATEAKSTYEGQQKKTNNDIPSQYVPVKPLMHSHWHSPVVPATSTGYPSFAHSIIAEQGATVNK
jgi:hypothetical protein